RTWRSSGVELLRNQIPGVLSTDVEVFRSAPTWKAWSIRALHGRGGLPSADRLASTGALCSLRTWRSSARLLAPPCNRTVLSTDVEVFRAGEWLSGLSVCALHGRGGLPMNKKRCPVSLNPGQSRFSGGIWGLSQSS